jgi:hypothetical protein
MHGNVLRRNIVYYLDEGAALFRFQNLPFDRNESDSNLIYHAGLPLRTGYPALRREYGPNLLNNGGLEESAPGDFPRGWGWAPAQESGTRVQVVEHPCHGGQRALLVEPPPLPTNGVLPQPVYLTFGHIPFQPGKAYRLSVWLRAEQPDTAVTLGVFSWKKNLPSWQRQSRCSLRPQWQQFELIVRLPQPGKPEYQATMDLLYWRLEIAPDTGRFWLDDVALREAELTDEWEGWQARGMDRHSLVADPLFADGAGGDYRLRPDSPAYSLGFQPIPVERIGPYADPLRASWPIPVLASQAVVSSNRKQPVPSFEEHTVDAAGPPNPWTKIAGDLDGDGRDELIVGGQKGPLVWYSWPQFRKHTIADSGWNTVSGAVGDVDGDGDLDVLLGGTVWFENPGNLCTAPDQRWKLHRIAADPTHDIAVADFNGDGRLDAVTRKSVRVRCQRRPSHPRLAPTARW